MLYRVRRRALVACRLSGCQVSIRPTRSGGASARALRPAHRDEGITALRHRLDSSAGAKAALLAQKNGLLNQPASAGDQAGQPGLPLDLIADAAGVIEDVLAVIGAEERLPAEQDVPLGVGELDELPHDVGVVGL